MEQNLSLYKIFYTVAIVGNISKAAKELYISQPAISKSITKLEQNLDTVLFLRNSRGVLLTEEGQILFKYLDSAFSTISTAEEQIRRIKELDIGHITIGVSTTLCKYILLPYLQKFIEQCPHIRITIECQSTNKTLQLLEDNKIDIGLVGKPHTLKNIDFHSLGEIEDIFVATDSYINHLKMREHAEQNDLFKTATLMLLDKENMTRQYIDDYFINNNIEINNLIEISTMDLLIDFAKIGLGVACVIKDFIKEDLKNKSLIELPLEAPIQKREIGFVFSKAVSPSSSVEKFIQFYKNYNN
ncbi:DNA-binding transcriptional LysR family regulator [Lachnotalea glycerini]|uniref:DNA-binding transcriptional LysR family regulator n=1 Tax=Lachnotalea glycerini TaxID=1763509 RepID=A0A255IAB4_9FIRM|nr:LysR family transcriptional regulator [Lachnotalea glycerini]PXV95376.1 DNA-binding transcriptional LysR family regulator [Lachnotalea glycerini]RDY30715.1 LysR family transcriptional regulator [Lachnotalea glycerini]